MKDLNWNILKLNLTVKKEMLLKDFVTNFFCVGHNNKIGLFRFKNQTGIEAEPIQAGSELVGFQAKYYET